MFDEYHFGCYYYFDDDDDEEEEEKNDDDDVHENWKLIVQDIQSAACIWKAAIVQTPFALPPDPQDQMDEALQFRQGFRLPGRVAWWAMLTVTGPNREDISIRFM